MLLQLCWGPEQWQPFQQDRPTMLAPAERKKEKFMVAAAKSSSVTSYTKSELCECTYMYGYTFANLHSLMATSHCPEATCWWRRVGKGLRLLRRIRMEILIKLSTDYVNKHVGLGLPGGYESSIASPQSAVAANELQQLRTLGEFTASEINAQ